MSYSNKKWYKPTNLRTKIIFVIILLFVIRLLANIPVPFINRDYLSTLFADSSAYSLLNMFSGGAFTQMTFMALGVTPYISASIILQLLTVTFPKLKDYQKSEYDKKRWKMLLVIVSVILGIIQSIGIAITLGHRGLFSTYNFGSVLLVCFLWVIGAIITVLIGEYISKYCIGNGISLILATNIVSELPGDVLNFWTIYVHNKAPIKLVIAAFIFVAVVTGLIAFTIVIQNAKKEISVNYPSSDFKTSTRKVSSSIPIQLNAAGVMPIIFTSTIFSLPLMFINTTNLNKFTTVLYNICNSSRWYSLSNWLGFIGIALYFAMVVAFAYFYTAITFNPDEIAARLQKRGACIPGIRPGKPTADYLYNKSKYMTGIGAVLLFFLTQVPMIITCTTSMGSLSFGGTSVIIVVGVIIETATTIKSDLMMKSYAKNSEKQFFGISLNKSNVSM